MARFRKNDFFKWTQLCIMNYALYNMHCSEMKAFQTFFKHFLKKSLKNEGTE